MINPATILEFADLGPLESDRRVPKFAKFCPYAPFIRPIVIRAGGHRLAMRRRLNEKCSWRGTHPARQAETAMSFFMAALNHSSELTGSIYLFDTLNRWEDGDLWKPLH
jgi:hypothetical protein